MAPDPAALLGDFRTSLWLPRYREGRWGEWSLRIAPAWSARGYWGGFYSIAGVPMLTGPCGEQSAAWMSIVPMEVESQEIGIAAATGYTVVLGLGMGWCAANVALNPAVERVTVVERDPDVVALVEAQGVFGQLPASARDKIELVEADGFSWRPDAPVDSLQADIWAQFVTPGKWDQLRRLQDNIGATSVYFWGQELELWRLACRARGGIPGSFEEGELAALASATNTALVLDSSARYGTRIAEAARWWTPQEGAWWEAA